MYGGNSSDACEIPDEDKLMYSDKTYSFDVSASFEGTWYSSGGTPLDLYFFDNDVELDDALCSSFLGDGICNADFNTVAHQYDQGDCCASTCEGPNCGLGAMTEVFDTPVTTADGFPTCKDPQMTPITIRLNNVYAPEKIGRAHV